MKRILPLFTIVDRAEIYPHLGILVSCIFSMKQYLFGITLIEQSLVKVIAVICLVSKKLIRNIRKTLTCRFFDQFQFVRRNAVNVSGDGKTISVCNCNELVPLPGFRIACSKTPFYGCEVAVYERLSNIFLPALIEDSTSCFFLRFCYSMIVGLDRMIVRHL